MMIKITDIQRLTVHPNQALIVRIPRDLTMAERARIVEAFRYALPETPIFVVRDDVQFSAIEQAEYRQDAALLPSAKGS